MPGSAHGSAQHLVGSVVALEHLLFRVPLQLAAQLHGDVPDMAHAHRAVADLDVADRPLARGDAVEPVVVMVIALVEMNVVWPELDLEDLGVGSLDLAAAHE